MKSNGHKVFNTGVDYYLMEDCRRYYCIALEEVDCFKAEDVEHLAPEILDIKRNLELVKEIKEYKHSNGHHNSLRASLRLLEMEGLNGN